VFHYVFMCLYACTAQKTIPDTTYAVSCGMQNLTHSLHNTETHNV